MADPLTRRLPPLPSGEWLEAAPPMTRLAFYGAAPAQAAAVAVWEPGFPTDTCRATVAGSCATLWLGPDEFLLLDAAAQAPAALAQRLSAAVGELPHAAVDLSHRQFALEVHGPHAETILRGACPLDLHVTQFPVGMCTRTVLAKADIVLWRTREDAFQLEVWRSFAGYVGGLLAEIAREFYPAQERSAQERLDLAE